MPSSVWLVMAWELYARLALSVAVGLTLWAHWQPERYERWVTRHTWRLP